MREQDTDVRTDVRADCLVIALSDDRKIDERGAALHLSRHHAGLCPFASLTTHSAYRASVTLKVRALLSHSYGYGRPSN